MQHTATIPPHPSTVPPAFPPQILLKVALDKVSIPDNYTSVMTPLPDTVKVAVTQGSSG